jgi:hypothetical protein
VTRTNLTPVYNVTILPQLPKFSIDIRKVPGEALGTKTSFFNADF